MQHVEERRLRYGVATSDWRAPEGSAAATRSLTHPHNPYEGPAHPVGAFVVPKGDPMSSVRVREPGKHAIMNPATGMHMVPDPAVLYSSDDPLVQAAPWAFATDEELAREAAERAAGNSSVPVPQVEQATRAPGEKRSVGRPRRDASEK
jgi:hypothetical protein